MMTDEEMCAGLIVIEAARPDSVTLLPVIEDEQKARRADDERLDLPLVLLLLHDVEREISKLMFMALSVRAQTVEDSSTSSVPRAAH